jgi:phage major head subunit gpT-like protein
VENLEYDASFQVMIRDIEDDQAGVFAKAATNLGAKAASYSKRAILNTLSQAKTATCFDGSSACASSHNVGTGNNVLTQDNASNDGKTFKIAALVCNDGMKPLLWQDRKAPKLNDDWSDKISSFRKAVNYWVDLEGASLFGAWWNVCWMDMTDTPTLAETQVAIQAFVTAFRGFYLPANLPGDPIEYMHEQLEPSVNSLMFVVDPRLEQLFRTVLTAETLTLTGGPATNIYRGWGDLIISNYMN